MMKKHKRVLAVLGMLIISLSLHACGTQNLRIGWREYNTRNSRNARYVTFDGIQKKTFRVDGNHTMNLRGDIEVKKGTLQVKVVNPSGEQVWKQNFQDNDQFTTTIDLTESGLYQLYFEGFDTGGSFDISWEIAG